MIHTYRYQDHNVVLDVYSGAIHILDDPAFFLVQELDKKNSTDASSLAFLLRARFPEIAEKDLQETVAEVQTLIDESSLFTEDSYKDLSLNLTERKTNVKALCLNVAHTCNLDCDYCFASQGKYHGERAVMTWDVAKRAIDFLIEQSGHHRNLDIDFFGGEPMLNWDLVKKTVEYAESIQDRYSKVFRFTFTTNGLLMDDEVNAFLNEHMHNVVLSLDGRKEIHDRLRHTISGKGSYDLIVPKFQRFVASRGDREYYVRGTYTKNNVDFASDVIHMANLGFHRLSMEPVIGDPEEPYMLSAEDLDALYEQYDLLTAEMMRRNRLARKAKAEGKNVADLPVEDQPFIFYHFMLNLSEGPCIYKRISGCGSGTEYMAVTPWGELFPCHQFVGEKPYSIGNVFDGILEEKIIGQFRGANCYSRPECHDCWAKLYCSGGCSANALHATGNLQGTVPFSCDLFRKRVECAIALKIDEAIGADES